MMDTIYLILIVVVALLLNLSRPRSRSKPMAEPLKVRTQHVHLVDHKELDRFIEEAYGLEGYSFVATEQAPNQSDHPFTVDGTYDADDDYDDIRDIKRGKVPLFRTQLLLDIMCKDGLLPAGNYLVNVAW